MKITKDVQKFAAEQSIAEEEALKKGVEEKQRGPVETVRYEEYPMRIDDENLTAAFCA